MSYPFFRPVTLVFLFLQALGMFALAGYTVVSSEESLNWMQWLSFIEFVMFGVLLFSWKEIFGRATAGQVMTEEEGLWRALKAFYPMLTSLRFVIWLLLCIVFVMGGIPEVNPVAFVGILTMWGINIFASNACYKYLLIYALHPTDLQARFMLMEWLNFAAALGFGLMVINIWPIPGYNSTSSVLDRVVYGAVGALDVVATILAWATLRMGLPWSVPEESKIEK